MFKKKVTKKGIKHQIINNWSWELTATNLYGEVNDLTTLKAKKVYQKHLDIFLADLKEATRLGKREQQHEALMNLRNATDKLIMLREHNWRKLWKRK